MLQSLYPHASLSYVTAAEICMAFLFLPVGFNFEPLFIPHANKNCVWDLIKNICAFQFNFLRQKLVQNSNLIGFYSILF